MTLPDELEARVASLAAELGVAPEECLRRCVAFVEQLRALLWLRGPMGGP